MSKYINLTQGKQAIVDDEDFESLLRYKWHTNKNNNTHYAIHAYKDKKTKKSKKIKMHRLIMNPTKHQEIDHKDGDGLNNQRSNLRICTGSQNNMNSKKRKNCSSKFKGVCWTRNDKKWRTRIIVDKKEIALGCFLKEIEAAKAYDKAAVKYFGDFARLNFNE